MDIFGAVGNWFKEMFFGLLIFLDTIIYNFVGYLYQVFIVISEVQVFSDAMFQAIVSRIYIVIGVFMLFVLVYSLLRSLVNPEELKEGDNSVVHTVKNIVIGIVVIALVPTIFSFAMQLQSTIVKSNIIGRVITGIGVSMNTNENVKAMGYTMAAETFHAFFYHPDGKISEETVIPGSKNEPISYNLNHAYERAASTGDFAVFINYTKNFVAGEITYNWLISTVCGAYLLWIILSFSIDLGVRAVKLGFYQLIAPIPAMCLALPGQKKIFDNWVKASLATYAEVFIRLLIIYLGMFIMMNIKDIFNATDFASMQLSFGVQQIILVLIILGVLTFIRQAPKLIGDIFGFDSGNIKLGIGKKLGEAGTFALPGAVAALGAGAVRNYQEARLSGRGRFTAFRSAVAGGASGVVRGFGKGLKAENFTGLATGVREAGDAATARARRRFSEADQAVSSGYSQINEYRDKIRSMADKHASVRELKRQFDTIQTQVPDVNDFRDSTTGVINHGAYNAAVGTYNAEVTRVRNVYESARDRVIDDAMSGVGGDAEHRRIADATQELNKSITEYRKDKNFRKNYSDDYQMPNEITSNGQLKTLHDETERAAATLGRSRARYVARNTRRPGQKK